MTVAISGMSGNRELRCDAALVTVTWRLSAWDPQAPRSLPAPLGGAGGSDLVRDDQALGHGLGQPVVGLQDLAQIGCEC